jgi:O-antigen/teichoic acid export membrane protein
VSTLAPDDSHAADGLAAPSLGAQAIWLLTAKGISFALAVALPLVLVRRLTQVDFGLYKQIFLVVGTTAAVMPLGFGMSAFYFLPREPTRQASIVANIVAFHFGIGLLVALVLATWPGLLAALFNSPGLKPHARLIALLTLLWTTGTFLEVVPVAMKDVRASTGLIVANQLSKTVLFLSAALAFPSVGAMIAAGIVYGVIQIAMMAWYIHSRFAHFWRAFDARLLWQQATYVLPVGGAGLLWRVQEDLHQAFVSNAFGPAAFAVYSVGLFKLPLIGILREAVGSVVLPRINELEIRNESRRILELVAAAARKLGLFYLPIYALLMVVGRDLIVVLFTQRYAAAWPIFAASMSFLPFTIIVLDPVTRASSERFLFVWLRLAIFLALFFVLWRYTTALGMVGVIVVALSTSIIAWSIAVFRMARLLKMTRRDWVLFADLGRVIVATVMAAAAAELVRRLLGPGSPWRVLLVCGPLFGAVYLTAVLQMRVLRRDEVTRLLRDVMASVSQRRGGAIQAASAAAPHVAGSKS